MVCRLPQGSLMIPENSGEPGDAARASAPSEPSEPFVPLTLEELDALPETTPPAVPSPIAEPAPSRSLTGRQKGIAAASVISGAALMLMVLTTRTGGSVSPAVQPPQAPAAVRAAAVVSTAAASTPPGWTEENRDTWIAGARRAVAFEVQAAEPIGIWMRTVRPSLVVRCESNLLDVFVFTDSAAKIEAQTIDHTVSLRFDDGEEVTTRWPDADTHDALFAPNGAEFAKRLAAAQTLRFGFTPHNAEPVTMQFAVAGLTPLLTRAAKEGCKAAAF